MTTEQALALRSAHDTLIKASRGELGSGGLAAREAARQLRAMFPETLTQPFLQNWGY